MREILFKAKLKNQDKWTEGFYCKRKETTYCFEEDYKRHPVPIHHLIIKDVMTDWGLPNELRAYEIDPETLCEYTGLNDKNGKKIFENDIVKVSHTKSDDNLVVVKYGTYICGCCDGVFGWYFDGGDIRDNHMYEVVGNVFDSKTGEENNK